jgi:hypothetical protein
MTGPHQLQNTVENVVRVVPGNKTNYPKKVLMITLIVNLKNQTMKSWPAGKKKVGLWVIIVYLWVLETKSYDHYWHRARNAHA